MDGSEGVRGGEDKALHSPHHIPLTLVVVGTETAVFDEHSKVRDRIRASIEAFQEVHIVVLCGGNFPKNAKIGDHIFLHPTNSRLRFWRVPDAVRLGRALPEADVVTVQDPFETGLAGWLIAQKLNAALHVQVHTDFLAPAFARLQLASAWRKPACAKLSLLNRARVFLAGFVLRHASRIRVVSPRIKESIEKRYALRAPITVLPIFVAIEKYQSLQKGGNDSRTNGDITVLVVARNAPEKNIALAIESFKKSAPQNSSLVVCTNVPGNDVDQRVRFVHDDPAKLYGDADLVLVPSKYEGYGMVIVEALARGLPVISTDVGIAREAGAIVTTEERFADALAGWFKSGPRTGELKYQPYRNFDEYIQRYVDDIASCNEAGKSQ